MSSPKKRKIEQSHVIYVLDRSGSMCQFGTEGYGSVQSAIEDLPKARGKSCLLSVFTFDNKHMEVVKGVLAEGYVLPEECMEPRGMTALRDAVSNALEYTGTLPKEHKKYLVVFTDGDDNSSKVSRESLSKMLKSSDVDITWLAAGEAKMMAATELGVDEKDILKVGSSGRNMRDSMIFSSQKVMTGFTEYQRRQSVE